MRADVQAKTEYPYYQAKSAVASTDQYTTPGHIQIPGLNHVNIGLLNHYALRRDLARLIGQAGTQK